MPISEPELKRYMNKKIAIQLNGTREVIGILSGFDMFLNLTLVEALEVTQKEKLSIGTIIIRGNSIISIEALDKL
ncbi:unnamed protein product [Candida verbasci]|uniref:Small nuclear ribonucleoprotein G n=1 Tax=Candida verbasci TaxID=1227364 RepID=A0A9W4X8Z3_9ASCO|nr:unnamed protein product [Candida verbasci]